MVRLSIDKLNKEILRNSVRNIFSLIPLDDFDLIKPSGKNWFEFDHFDSFDFNSETITPNLNFSSNLLRILYLGEYSLIDDLFIEVLEQNRTFGYDLKHLLVSNEFVEACNLKGLLRFLENEIYEFESVQFDYNQKVLIDRFYRENDLLITPALLKDAYELISKIKLEDVNIDIQKLKKNQKREFNNQIFSIVEEFLINANNAMSTKYIHLELNKNNIEIDRVNLLTRLNKNRNTFVRLGNGTWGLKSWTIDELRSGSIREIVENKLKNRDTPMHISEIIELLGKYRNVSERSVMTNLRLNEHGIFHFFHCSFVGLSSTKYPDYWYQIPKFMAATFMSIYRNSSIGDEVKIKELIKLGYPEIHCNYVLMLRNNAKNEG
jgi:hypothetical protein